MSGRGLLMASLVLMLSAPVFGQSRFYGRGNQGPGQGANLVTADGNIEMVGNGVVKMNSKGGGPSVLVTMTPATKVQFTGTATPEFIHGGLAVEFTADVDKKHMVKDKITQLTIITLTAERGPGLFPGGETAAAAKPAEADNFAFGGGGGVNGPDAPPEKGSGHKASPRKAATAVKLPANCLVRGQIKSFKVGKLMINIGHGVVRAELADEAQVAVDTADLSLARRGDTISVRGAPGVGAMIGAASVTVHAAEPLTGPKKRSSPAAKKHPKKDSGDDAGDLKSDKKAAGD